MRTRTAQRARNTHAFRRCVGHSRAVTCRVLLCDDAAPYRRLARAVLESRGVEVIAEAADGEECLGLLHDIRPDVVLLDVNMAGMDGLTALPLIRRNAPEVGVVMLSTGTAADLEQESLRRGARAFLQKPRDIFALPDLLESVLV
jgi:CheY-like chemotaxis protein